MNEEIKDKVELTEEVVIKEKKDEDTKAEDATQEKEDTTESKEEDKQEEESTEAEKDAIKEAVTIPNSSVEEDSIPKLEVVKVEEQPELNTRKIYYSDGRIVTEVELARPII